MSAITVTLAIAVALLISISLSCGGDVVKMGTEGAYPPYSFVNDAGEVDGFEPADDLPPIEIANLGS